MAVILIIAKISLILELNLEENKFQINMVKYANRIQVRKMDQWVMLILCQVILEIISGLRLMRTISKNSKQKKENKKRMQFFNVSRWNVL